MHKILIQSTCRTKYFKFGIYFGYYFQNSKPGESRELKFYNFNMSRRTSVHQSEKKAMNNTINIVTFQYCGFPSIAA